MCKFSPHPCRGAILFGVSTGGWPENIPGQPPAIIPPRPLGWESHGCSAVSPRLCVLREMHVFISLLPDDPLHLRQDGFGADGAQALLPVVFGATGTVIGIKVDDVWPEEVTPAEGADCG